MTRVLEDSHKIDPGKTTVSPLEDHVTTITHPLTVLSLPDTDQTPEMILDPGMILEGYLQLDPQT